jgi:hypothetical protein
MTGKPQKITGIPEVCGQVFLQPAASNSNPIAVGAYEDELALDNYGVLIPMPINGIPVAPIYISGPIQVESIGVIGTAGEILHISAVTT